METHNIVGWVVIASAVATAAGGIVSENESLVGLSGVMGIVGTILVLMTPPTS